MYMIKFVVVAIDYYKHPCTVLYKSLKLLYCKTVTEIFCIQTSSDSRISPDEIEWKIRKYKLNFVELLLQNQRLYESK